MGVENTPIGKLNTSDDKMGVENTNFPIGRLELTSSVMGVGFMNSPIGLLELTSIGGKLVGVRIAEKEGLTKSDAVIEEAKRQLDEYFVGSRREFDLPIGLGGSEFFRAVCAATKAIPYGETRTYGQIATSVSHPKASRAVGRCLNRNRLLIIVPCHRVVSSGGMGGFALGVKVKEYLLGLEKSKLDITGRLENQNRT